MGPYKYSRPSEYQMDEGERVFGIPKQVDTTSSRVEELGCVYVVARMFSSIVYTLYFCRVLLSK